MRFIARASDREKMSARSILRAARGSIRAATHSRCAIPARRLDLLRELVQRTGALERGDLDPAPGAPEHEQRAGPPLEMGVGELAAAKPARRLARAARCSREDDAVAVEREPSRVRLALVLAPHDRVRHLSILGDRGDSRVTSEPGPRIAT